MTARSQWRWAVWATGILAGFAFLEHGAYVHGNHPTLTAVLRYWLGIAPAHPRRTIRAAIAAGGVTGGLVALAVHLARVPPIHGPAPASPDWPALVPHHPAAAVRPSRRRRGRGPATR